MRQGSRQTGVMILVEPLLIGIITEKAHIGRDPYHIITLEDIGNIIVLQGLEKGGYLLSHQFPVPLSQPVKAAVDANPWLSVAFYVTDGHVEHAPRVGIGTYLVYLAVVPEGDQADLLIIDDPDPSKGITVASDRGLNEKFLQFRMIRDNRTHRPQVNDIDTLVERHPQPTEIILRDAPARLAVQVEPRFHYAIAIVSHQSTPKSGYPEETARIFKDIADIIMRQAIAQVQIRHVVALRQDVLLPSGAGQRNQKKKKEDKKSHLSPINYFFSLITNTQAEAIRKLTPATTIIDD